MIFDHNQKHSVFCVWSVEVDNTLQSCYLGKKAFVEFDEFARCYSPVSGQRHCSINQFVCRCHSSSLTTLLRQSYLLFFPIKLTKHSFTLYFYELVALLSNSYKMNPLRGYKNENENISVFQK